MEEKWWHNSVVYQVYPRSFKDSNGDGIGDIPGIISKLDYIKELGVDIIWLCPVYASPNDDNGYDISHYFQIHPEFGTLEDMDQLLAEAAKRKIAIMMDIVANHTSDEHPWFLESKSSKDNPYREYYVWRNGINDGPPSDLQSIFSGSAWEFDKETNQYYLHMFSKKQPDLNWHHPPVREAMYEVMRFWINKGIKGFRFDVIDLIAKELEEGIIVNGPLLHTYLQEMHHEVLEGADIVTVGETGGADLEQALLFTSPERKELDMVFSFEHIALDEQAGKQKWDWKTLDLADLKRVLSNWQTGLAGRGWNSLFWSNHDQPRIVSRWGNDQEYRYESATMLGTILHLMRGTPYIYQGEEIGMTNVQFHELESYRDIETINMYRERKEQGFTHEDIMKSIYVKGRDNARTPMQWNAEENAGFTEATPWIGINTNYSAINVENDINGEKSIYQFYKKLIMLRKNNKLVVYGDYHLLDSEPEVFAYTRSYQNEEWRIVCNFTGREVESSLLCDDTIIVHNYAASADVLRPYEAIVYKMEK